MLHASAPTYATEEATRQGTYFASGCEPAGDPVERKHNPAPTTFLNPRASDRYRAAPTPSSACRWRHFRQEHPHGLHRVLKSGVLCERLRAAVVCTGYERSFRSFAMGGEWLVEKFHASGHERSGRHRKTSSVEPREPLRPSSPHSSRLPQPEARTGGRPPPEPRASLEPARRNRFASRTGRQSAPVSPRTRAPANRSVRRSKSIVTIRRRPSPGYSLRLGLGSRVWRQRPAAGRPRRGAGEVLRCGRAPSAGLAWGRFLISPKPPPSPIPQRRLP
jgi:hypothetical protein